PGDANFDPTVGCTTADTSAVSAGTGTLSPSGQTSEASASSSNVAASVTTIGTYCFLATYDPGSDPNYQGSKGISFDGTTECFAVTAPSTTTTAQNWLPNDSAHVTSAAGITGGTVDFSLFTGADCTGTLIHTFSARPVTVDNTTTPASGNASTD